MFSDLGVGIGQAGWRSGVGIGQVGSGMAASPSTYLSKHCQLNFAISSSTQIFPALLCHRICPQVLIV